MATLVISPETERDLERLASLTGRTPGEAVRDAVRSELAQVLPSARGARKIDWDRVREIQQRVAGTIDRTRTPDELVGYDSFGAPI